MISEEIFRWAGRTPERTALIYNGVPRSYRWFAGSIALARGYFARRGWVGPGYAVLAVYNLVDFWILSLALRSLGMTTAAAPAVEAIPQLGLRHIRCVVCSAFEDPANLESTCAALGLKLLRVNLEGEPSLALGVSTPPYPTGGHLLLTSGTTGFRKAVLMSPALDAVFLRRMVQIIGLDANSLLCVFNFGPWSAAGYRWLASPWIVGGASLIEQGRETFSALRRPGITHAVLNPGLLSTVLAAPADAFSRSETMHLAVTGGAMTRQQADRAKARITPHLFNWLASTEAGGIAYTKLDGPDDHGWHRPIPDRQIEIVDECECPVPVGVVGQLRVRIESGPTGYQHDAAATDAFFRRGYFYPGDLAVMRDDGRLALQGRLTEILNVGGDKILPAPIEQRLAERFRVRDIAIYSRQNESGEEEIHIVIEASAPLDSQKLNEALSREFGDACSIHIHYLAEFPRNDMGKVMRRAVRAETADDRRDLRE